MKHRIYFTDKSESVAEFMLCQSDNFLHNFSNYGRKYILFFLSTGIISVLRCKFMSKSTLFFVLKTVVFMELGG